MKNYKYTLTEAQLKELLLISQVTIGVRVESEEHQDEESTSFETDMDWVDFDYACINRH